MAVRGRKPKPTALKVLEGNPGHRPLNKKEPMPKGKLPRCPEWLEDDAKKEWKRLGKVLAEMVDVGAMVADDEKRRVSYIIISKNKVLRLLIIRSHSNPYFLWGYFWIKTLANLRLFFNVCK